MIPNGFADAVQMYNYLHKHTKFHTSTTFTLHFARNPYSNRAVITSRSQHMGPCRIPAYTVHNHGVAMQNLYWHLHVPFPNVDLLIVFKG
jgi:hypothetical protein